MECVGEVLTESEAENRPDKSYFFSVNLSCFDNRFVVDAFHHGNMARFVNHSSAPNARINSISSTDGGFANYKLVLFATQDLEAEEEITVNYLQE